MFVVLPSEAATPQQIGTDNTWASISAGYVHTIALKSDGTLWAWGANWWGQLGDGTNTDRWSPQQIGADNTWASIAAGTFHTIAMKSDGTLWVWGDNRWGQLGDGTNTYRWSPVQITGTCGDTVPPVLDVTVTPGLLWPPNHKMVNITPLINVSDNLTSNVQVELVSVTSSEPDNGLGDGDTPNDIVINPDGTILLRAERSGMGIGRVYTITYKATDLAGNVTVSSTTAIVPHDMGKK
ncbi:MAG: hypothetical protein Q8M71_08490 [Thermodesulfovibrionales bacterium]|nr:hypothetical protein [Thermodesulfovibrionales bacterium]